METKLVLYIGAKFKPDFVGTIRKKRLGTYRCIFANTEILGLSAALVMHPDIVICELRPRTLPMDYVKFKLKLLPKNCRIFYSTYSRPMRFDK